MKIYITRHGQTKYNKLHLMQGLTDEPLNETGIEQAKLAHQQIKDIHFDAVYASDLDRAITTASIMAGIDKKDVIIDPRLREVDFGKYELKKYYLLGIRFSLFWALPEIFKAPKSVEPISSMVNRSTSFLKELEQKGYENVLISCHGGIIRSLCGYLEDKKNGIKWRPKPHNCELRVYESINGKHKKLENLNVK